MKAEKAARIQSYLVRNSARASIRKRKPEETADYYEKTKYLDTKQPDADTGRTVIPDNESGAERNSWMNRSKKIGKRVFGRTSAWSLISFVLVILMLLFVFRFIR